MSSNGLEQIIAKAWLHSVLSAIPELDGIGIHDGYAPQGANYPVVIFRVHIPARSIQGHRGVTLISTMRYLVEVVTDEPSFTLLIPYAQAIHGTLNGARNTETGYGFMRSCTYEEAFEMTEIDQEAGKEYRRLGGFYRLEVQA